MYMYTKLPFINTHSVRDSRNDFYQISLPIIQAVVMGGYPPEKKSFSISPQSLGILIATAHRLELVRTSCAFDVLFFHLFCYVIAMLECMF